MAEIKVTAITGNKEYFAGIQTDVVGLSLEADKKEKEIVFEFPKSATVVAKGSGTDADEKGEISFTYDWKINETYKLLIAIATDSAENFSLFTGYAWLATENKWKLIGTCKIAGRWNSIQEPAIHYTATKKGGLQVETGAAWCQRRNGAWWNLKKDSLPNPVINLAGHIDSAEQQLTEIKLIEDAIASGKTDVQKNKDNVYYTIMKEGTGRQVAVTDTVIAFYKGYLFPDGEVFDQTKDSPATFPLNRLIKGWQIGVPFCKVGGKIKLVIPSDMAYSIRTRSPKIPPNSILVFEVEVVGVKSVN
jgi:hypothetical protein